MTVYRIPSGRPYQRHFRIFSWSAIGVLLGIMLFAIYEPAEVSRSTNIALALLMSAIVVVAIFYGMFLSSKEAIRKLQQSFQWELTEDKVVQTQTNGETIEIPLQRITTLREFNGWLLVGGSESPKEIMISRNVDGYNEIRSQLMARCPLTAAPKANPLASVLPVIAIAALFGFVIGSHVPAIVIGCGIGLVVLWPPFVGYGLRPFWRSKSSRRMHLLVMYFLSWLILVWFVFKSIEAVLQG